AGGCRPDLCPIYAPGRYTHLHVPVMPTALPWVARWDRDVASQGDTAAMLLHAPGLEAGQALGVQGSFPGAPSGTVECVSEIDRASAPWSTWDGAGNERRFTFTMRGAGRVAHATYELVYRVSNTLVLTLRDWNDRPLANRKYRIEAAGAMLRGVTDA